MYRLVHVDDETFERDVANRRVEEEVFDGSSADGPQRRQHEEQLAETERLGGPCGVDVAAEGELRMVLKDGDRLGVSQRRASTSGQPRRWTRRRAREH